MKINARKGGFTLVEIMIVVAIIALLASIAVPNFMRARQRSQGSLIKDDLRILDAAIDQWAIEKNKKNGEAVTVSDLKDYVKTGSAMYTSLANNVAPNDPLGTPYVITNVGTAPQFNVTTYTALSDACDTVFFSPFSHN